MEVLWNERLVYPHTSLLACSFKAGAVSRLPAITALVKGRKLPILSRNLSVSYGWSRNPANVVLDLLTNPRYIAGQRTFTTNAPLVSKFSSLELGLKILTKPRSIRLKSIAKITILRLTRLSQETPTLLSF